MLPGGAWTLAAATVLLVLAAAKAHGRQVRLEREQRGHWKVDFAASDNPPFVLWLWRRDRIVFWTVFLVGTFATIVAGLLGDAMAGLGVPAAAAVRLAWAFAASFCVAGLLSFRRLLMRDEGEAAWLRRSRWGSLGWWGLVAGAAGFVALASSPISL